RVSLGDELGARGPLQEALVGRMSHHIAALELSRHAELAAIREGARQAVPLGAISGVAPAAEIAPNAVDAVLSAAASSESLERITGYGRSHERGLLAVLAKFFEIRHMQSTRQSRGATGGGHAAGGAPTDAEPIGAGVFSDDATCQEYLE